MKNRKIVVVALLLVAVLTLGMGYAALNDYLTIGGFAEISATGAETGFDEKVYFLNDAPNSPTVVQGSTTGSFVDTATISDDPDIARFSVNSINSSGDKVVLMYTIKNDSDHNAKIYIASTKTGGSTQNPYASSDMFSVTYATNEDGTGVIGNTVEQGVPIAKGATVNVYVIVTLKEGKTPPTSGTVTADFTCEITAETID
ncbi:MAG: hypothetical protein IKA64_01325 [Clostridia bacterium]|nr:hypothetical protein [Clostridia bacterium]